MNIVQQKIEALLFYKNEPLKYTWLAKQLKLEESDIRQEIYAMSDFYKNRGITLVISDDEVSLMTSPVAREFIQEFTKNKEERELSKQALETLAIIAYKDRITKSEIDYIRGVNSVFILRNLLIRGLITKKQNILDKRSPFYVITHDLLSFLGIEKNTDLPGREQLYEKLNILETDYLKEQEAIVKEPIIVNDSKD